MYTHRERPIAKNEVQRLQKGIRKMERARKALPTSTLGCLACTIPICLMVILVKPQDPVNRWGALALFGVFALMTAAIHIFITREWNAKIRELKRTIEEGSVSEHHIRADRCLEISDENEEVPKVYLFDVGDQGTVVLSEEDAEAKKFPSSDFTILYTLDGNGQIQNVHVRVEGSPLEPMDSFLRSEVAEVPDFDRVTLLHRDFDALREELLRS